MSGLTEDEARAMQRAAESAIAYRQGVPDRPVPPRIGLDEAVARFRTPLDEQGQSADAVIANIIANADDGLNQMSSPNFYGYVLGGSYPVGVAADMLVSAWGQNVGSSAETPAMTGMERAVCDWVIDLLGLPPDSGAGLATGATLANTTGVMAARNALLAREGWDVEARGLFGAPEISVLIGEDAHSAPFAALRYAGFGADRVRRVATDEQGRIRADSFADALAETNGPTLVVLQAGQINSGAFDPFADIVPMARRAGAWVHVDGAFGLWLAAVPELEPRLKGVQQADSWAVDLHKWLNAPFDSGVVIVRDRAPLVASMSARGAYLPELTDHWEPTDSVFELSRRARGIPSYAILRHLGRSGVRALITRHCRLAQRVADRISAIPGLSVLNEVASNQVAIQCGEGSDSDQRTNAVLDIVQRRGHVYPSHGYWQGKDIIRASIIGYATQDQHVDLLVSEIAEAWDTVRGKN
ncbi:MAG: aminotransferase class V-fold PLP-dependent enzyme [Pseudomonadota bacterium]